MAHVGNSFRNNRLSKMHTLKLNNLQNKKKSKERVCLVKLRRIQDIEVDGSLNMFI